LTGFCTKKGKLWTDSNKISQSSYIWHSIWKIIFEHFSPSPWKGIKIFAGLPVPHFFRTSNLMLKAFNLKQS